MKWKRALLAPALGSLLAAGCGAQAPGAVGELPPEAATQSCANLAPTMTSNTSAGGVVTRSGAYDSTYEAWQAFDSTNYSMWISGLNQTPAWIAMQLTAGAQKVDRYAIDYMNGSITTRAPKEWTLQASNGNGVWTVIDTQTNQINWGGNERREFAVASPGSYSQYKLVVTDDNDTRSGVVVVSMGRLELLSCGGSQQSQPTWTRYFGSSAHFTRVHDLSGDPVGRSYVTGMANGAVDGVGPIGPLDAYVRATDWDGNEIWSQPLGAADGVTFGYGTALNGTFEELYVVGATSGTLDGNAPSTGGGYSMFVSRIRYTGAKEWTRTLGMTSSGDVQAFGVTVDPSERAIVVGSTAGALDGNAAVGSIDAFATWYDASGNKLFTRQVGAPGSAQTIARRAVADGAGNVFVAGWSTGSVDGQARVGSQDVFVTKYSAAGVKQWTRQLGAPGANSAWLYGAAVDRATGEIYLGGYSGGAFAGAAAGPSTSAFVVKLDTNGNRLWTRALGSGSGASASGLVFDSGYVYLAGDDGADPTNPASHGTIQHTFVVKYDASGVQQSITQQAAGSGSLYQTALAKDQYGAIYLGGYTYGSFGGQTPLGSPDGFMIKLPAQ